MTGDAANQTSTHYHIGEKGIWVTRERRATANTLLGRIVDCIFD